MPSPGGGGPLVVIDPGHNGGNGSHTKEINRPVDAGGFTKACNTTGTAGGGLSEATFTWETSLKLKALLEARGAQVIMTRNENTGWGPCVDQRGLTAANANADLLVSIHADGAGAGSFGFHVIHPALVRGFTDGTVGPSDRAAAMLRDALVEGGFRPANYIGSNGLDRRGDLGTLNRAGVPAIMLESGNMKNADDLTMMSSAEGQERLVNAIAAGVGRYLGSVDKPIG